MAAWLEESKIGIIIAIVVIIILIAVYYEGYSSKATSSVTVTNDEGVVTAPSAADQASATALAKEMYAALDNGLTILWSITSSSQPYEDLAATSNVVFTLTFSSYNNLYQRSLLADLNNDWQWLGESATDSILQRAKNLGITQ